MYQFEYQQLMFFKNKVKLLFFTSLQQQKQIQFVFKYQILRFQIVGTGKKILISFSTKSPSKKLQYIYIIQMQTGQKKLELQILTKLVQLENKKILQQNKQFFFVVHIKEVICIIIKFKI
eukprot:TRINITY_DN984_c0_g1_i1.p2 TRINITY_DN984_c0_g1~~TRINITY_DN984_c0_g1_i1.p2  ORF type:complete len:120 (+),score=0.23 TRINITY_DN984_c0_g1_i1:111-470(+)